ncbi:DUF423 domain-containing protein [Bryobacterales bacterium F-183]|nr:DUF423 domain-containing protein [Bryobacterales bacterium F-183]
MTFGSLAAALLAIAVALGAFGAHALKARFDAYSMGIWEKAVLYHFLHALGLLIVSQLPDPPKVTAWLLVAGIVFFSGSLYVLAFTGIPILGAVTPIGGVCFIAAWILLAVKLSSSK